MKLSIVIPVYNEALNVRPLYNSIKNIIKIQNYKDYEILFIDDGSRDQTYAQLLEISNSDSKVKVIRHNKNMGQTAALVTGFRNANGEIVITMDGDLQNDPMDIPKLIEKLSEGYDLVCGWRYKRHDPFLTKKLPSIFANKLRNFLAKDSVHDSGCSLKAFRGNLLKNLTLLGDAHRYLPFIFEWEGYKVGEVKVNHNSRKSGKTKYGSMRLFRGFFDLLTLLFWYKYSKRPLHFFGAVGLIIILFAILLFIYILIKVYIILGIRMPVGPLLLFTAILFLSGLQFILIGFIGEMQARTHYIFNNFLNEKQSHNEKFPGERK